jgi:DNA-binding NarL/FixJ family response regulator
MSDTLPPRLRVMLLEDHTLVRHAMELLLKHDYGFDVAGSFCTPRELFTALKQGRPDVIVMDYALGARETDGAKLIRSLRLQHPHIRVLVFSAHCNAATMAIAQMAGAHGFIGKAEHKAELHRAIRAVAAGRTYFSRHLIQLAGVVGSVHRRDAPRKDFRSEWLESCKLSAREHEVLRCMLDGMSITAIARKYSRAVATISAQKHSAFRKLGLSNDQELFKLRYQAG